MEAALGRGGVPELDRPRSIASCCFCMVSVLLAGLLRDDLKMQA